LIELSHLIGLLTDSKMSLAYSLFAQSSGGSTTYSASWALVLFCIILGLMVALNPAKRTTEIKKHKD
jgi:hypothetical protein